eukprot:5817993-Pyramimonas_sp.AAC.1
MLLTTHDGDCDGDDAWNNAGPEQGIANRQRTIRTPSTYHMDEHLETLSGHHGDTVGTPP